MLSNNTFFAMILQESSKVFQGRFILFELLRVIVLEGKRFFKKSYKYRVFENGHEKKEQGRELGSIGTICIIGAY